MSLLNGLSQLGQGLTSFGTAAAKDMEETTRLGAARASLLNGAASATAPAVSANMPPVAPASGSAKVPTEYLPFYQEASKRTGIPVDVLIAQAKQESNFNPDAVGGAGEIGLHQIKPSTASNPGFGIQSVDPADLKDPRTNINFAADYLKARAGPRVDFSNPATVDAALKNFNGGGDPNYVANVRRYMGGDTSAAAPDPLANIHPDLTRITAPGGAKFTVASSVADKFAGLVTDMEKAGYRLDPASSGGYNPRMIAGTNTPSKHAYGLAVDLNWHANQQGADTHSDIPAELARSLAARYGLKWGGDFSGKQRDPMHFEVAS